MAGSTRYGCACLLDHPGRFEPGRWVRSCCVQPFSLTITVSSHSKPVPRCCWPVLQLGSAPRAAAPRGAGAAAVWEGRRLRCGCGSSEGCCDGRWLQGPTDTPATELQAAQRDVRAAAEALLRDMLSTQQFRAHEEVVREIEGCGRMVAALRSACMRTLEERLREVLSQQWERERREMLADVATAEAASVSRAQAQLVEAEASAEVRPTAMCGQM